MEESTDKRTKKIAKHGRPRIEESISEAILRIRKETGWGYTKIVQAMRRLGHHISRQTVKNILIEAGLGPSRMIIQIPGATSSKGMQQHCGNVTLHARRSGPSKAWSTSISWCSFTSEVDESGSLPALNIQTHMDAQQARNFAIHIAEEKLPCTILGRDNDKKYAVSFDAVFKSMDCEVKPITPMSPNLQAHVGTSIQTIQA